MKNYLGRMPFIFSLQHEEVLELPEESLNDLNTKLAELSCDMPLSLPLPQEDEENENEEDQEKEVDKETNLPIYSMEEVSCHDSFDDCWMILYDKVNNFNILKKNI